VIEQITRFIPTWNPSDIGPTYAREERELPCISILSGDGGNVDHYVGNSLGYWYDENNLTIAEEVGPRDRASCEIVIFAGSDSHLRILLALVRGALEYHRADFDELGLNEMEVNYTHAEPDEQSLAWPAMRVTVNVEWTCFASVALRYGNAPNEFLVSLNETGAFPTTTEPHFRYP